MKRALHIFSKESREMLRDKRVINAAFVAPVFMIILFIFLFGMIETKLSRKPDLSLAFVRYDSAPFLDALKDAKDVEVTLVADVEAGLAMMDEGDVRAVVDIGEGFAESLGEGEALIRVHYDSSEPLSSIAMSSVRNLVTEMNKQSARTVMAQNGIPEAMAEPITFEPVDEDEPEGLGGSMIVGLIPYLIVLWAFYGGFSTVSDLVAGEKERGTMETLLISPVKRSEVAYGKFLALAAICLTSSLTTLVGVIAIGVMRLEITSALFPTGLHISPMAFLQIAGVLLPLVLFFAGLLLAVSAYAKNVREAQTYLTLVSFVVLMPAIFSQFIGLTGAQNAAWVRWTPILNSSVALKEALMSDLAVGHFLTTALVSLVLGAIVLWISVKLFQREEILTRT